VPTYTIVQAPSHLGLRAPGVERLPEALLAAGLAERLGAFLLGDAEESGRDAVLCLQGNRLQAIKWRQWKLHLFLQDDIFSTFSPYSSPHLHNLEWDPGSCGPRSTSRSARSPSTSPPSPDPTTSSPTPTTAWNTRAADTWTGLPRGHPP
jgi:hypothetical protein